MSYEDAQGSQYEDGGNDWTVPVERKSAWSIDPPPAAEYQSQRFTPVQPVQPKAFKPAAPGAAAPSGSGILDGLSRAIRSGGNAIADGMNKVVGAATSKPDYQAGVLKRQGYQPADYSYSAADDHPANVMYKFDPAKNETRYQIPGVKGTDGAPGYATFQGQRKGGGSFSVVPGLSEGEKNQYAQIVERERLQQKQADDMALLQRAMAQFGSGKFALEYLTNQTRQQQHDQDYANKNDQFNQRLNLDRDRLDIAKMTADERQKMSKQWLEFQRWRSEQADKARAFRANKRRGVNTDMGAVVPPDAALVADINGVGPIVEDGVADQALREPAIAMAA